MRSTSRGQRTEGSQTPSLRPWPQVDPTPTRPGIPRRTLAHPGQCGGRPGAPHGRQSGSVPAPASISGQLPTAAPRGAGQGGASRTCAQALEDPRLSRPSGTRPTHDTAALLARQSAQILRWTPHGHVQCTQTTRLSCLGHNRSQKHAPTHPCTQTHSLTFSHTNIPPTR